MRRLLQGKGSKSSGKNSDGGEDTLVSKSPSIAAKGKAALKRALHRDNSPPSGPTNSQSVGSQEMGHEQTLPTVTDDISNAKQKMSIVGLIPAPAQTAIGAVGFANTAMSKVDALNATYLQPLRIFHTVVNGISNLHPYAQMALSALTVASQLILSQANLDASIQDLLSKIGETYRFIMEDDTLSKLDAMKGTLAQISQVVQESAQFIAKYSETKNFWVRLGRNIFSETSSRVTKFNDALDKLMQQFRDYELRDIHVSVHQMREDLSLEGMPYAGGVGLNTAKKCLDGTRTEILNEIIDWINNTNKDSHRVFWLHGQAGKGKSAIAHTIALYAQNLKMLGSCFCFTRARQNDGLHVKLITTMARDLADRDLRLRPLLADVIAQNRALKDTEDIAQQWQKFVLEPLSNLEGPTIGNVVIVVDALDESGDVASRKHVLKVLASQEVAKLPPNFRILLTSRPLADIHQKLDGAIHIKHRSMEEIITESTTRDIRLYVCTELQELDDTFSDEEFDQLSEKAAGVFEWARLACDFIQPGFGVIPKERFQEIMSHAPGEGRTLLDEMYVTFLRELTKSSSSVLPRFRSVMRQILWSREPLTIGALDAMRRMFPREQDCYGVGIILGFMASLLMGTMDPSTAVRPLHASFYDFLTDQKRSGEFFIDESDIHLDLAFASVRVMHEGLRFNICGLETSYLRNSEVPDLSKRVEQNIPAQLAYSCRFWANHLQQTGFHYDLACSLKAFFDGERVLFWLEVLGLLKFIGDAYMALVGASTWLEGKDEFGDSLTVVKDVMKFVRNFAGVINESTPHLYVSALPFSPSKSVVTTRLSLKFPDTAHVAEGLHDSWPSSQHVLRGHGDRVSMVTFSPDGKWIASSSFDHTIRLWNAETGLQMGNPFRGHDNSVLSVAFSPDGKLLVSSSHDCTVRLWDVDTGVQVGKALEGHTDSVRSVAFSPDGTWIASGSYDLTIRLWDVLACTEKCAPLRGHTKSVYSITVSPDGKTVLSGSYDKTIRIWDVETGTQIGDPLQGHTGWVESVAFSPNGKVVVSGSSDYTIRLWDVETHAQLGTPLQGHTFVVQGVAFSPDGNCIASGSFDNTVRLWDVETRTQIGDPLQGHTNNVNSVVFSVDGKRVVSGGDDGMIYVWDVEAGIQTGNPVQGHTRSIQAIAISPNGEWIASGSADNTIQLWDANSGIQVGNPLEGHTESVLAVAFSCDGKYVISGSHDNSTRLWEVKRGTQVGKPFQATSSVLTVAISKDGKYIISGSHDKIQCWDTKMGSQVAKPFEGHTDTVRCLGMSPDGRYIVSGSHDHTIRVWDLETGEQVGSPFQGHTNSIYAMALSLDGKYVVSGSDDKSVRLWDLKMGVQVGNAFEGHKKAVLAVAISPDGNYIASGSSDGIILFWDVKTGTQVGKPLQAHSAWVWSVEFSPDGKYLASASDDKTIRLWSSPRNQPTHTHDGPQCRSEVQHPMICFSSTTSHALQDAHRLFTGIPDTEENWCDMVKFTEDGWITGPKGQLLLWVPSVYHKLLYTPRNTLVIPRGGPQLDLSRMAHGHAWAQSYSS